MDQADVVAYKKYNPFHFFCSQEELFEVVQKHDYKSNRQDWEEAFEMSCAYERVRPLKTKYQRNYAVQLTILIPRNITNEEVDTFVQMLMQDFDEKYTYDIPYIYRHFHQNKGEYIEIIALQREVYSEPHKVMRKYDKDIYYNPANGNRICKKDTVGAVLRCKKGDPIIRKGEIQYDYISVSPKKVRCFNFKGPHDEAKRRIFYRSFNDQVHEKIVQILQTMTGLKPSQARQVEKEKGDTRDLVWQQIKIIKYNELVSKVNRKLAQYYYVIKTNCFWLEQDEVSEIKASYAKAANSMRQLFKNKCFTYHHRKIEFCLKKTTNDKYLSLSAFTDALDLLKDHIKEKLQKHDQEFNSVIPHLFPDEWAF